MVGCADGQALLRRLTATEAGLPVRLIADVQRPLPPLRPGAVRGGRLKQLQALARRAREERRAQQAAALVQHRAFASNQYNFCWCPPKVRIAAASKYGGIGGTSVHGAPPCPWLCPCHPTLSSVAIPCHPTLSSVDCSRPPGQRAPQQP